MNTSRDDDQRSVQKLLRQKDKVEALTWMEGNQWRNVGELSHKASLALVRRLYRFGAIEVVAVDIGAHAGFESTDTLIATLPHDPASRRKIFDWDNERVQKMGYEPYPDEGQDHHLIWFD
jgi:hypothetical protein